MNRLFVSSTTKSISNLRNSTIFRRGTLKLNNKFTSVHPSQQSSNFELLRSSTLTRNFCTNFPHQQNLQKEERSSDNNQKEELNNSTVNIQEESVNSTEKKESSSWLKNNIIEFVMEAVFSILFAPIKYALLLMLFLLMVWIIGGKDLLMEWISIFKEITKLIYDLVVGTKTVDGSDKEK